jgi:hypothetical protein
VAVIAILEGWDPGVTAAVVAAIVSVITLILGAPLRMWVERHLQTFRLKSEYESEQRKELRSLIGRYHGRLVAAAESFHQRLRNLYVYEDRRWLDSPETDFKDRRWLDSHDSYYFKTTQYRFPCVCSLARAFEREAYFIDSRIAEQSDFDFLKFIKAFLWATTSAALFKNLGYDETKNTDHFFADQIREICDHFCSSSDMLLSFSEFEQSLRETETFDAVGEFFHGLHASEARLRWDRLVVYDLMLMAFLGTVGYETQYPANAKLAEVARRIRHPEIRRNMIGRLANLGLDSQPEMKRVTAALVSAGLPHA